MELWIILAAVLYAALAGVAFVIFYYIVEKLFDAEVHDVGPIVAVTVLWPITLPFAISAAIAWSVLKKVKN